MTDDPMISTWKASDTRTRRAVRETVEAALTRDRSERGRERAVRVLSLVAAAILWPLLLWCAARGVVPIVRGGYALMAAGLAVILFAEFAFLSWSRKSRPTASDSLAQLGTNIGLLKLQSVLLRSTAAWCAPTFLGACLIGWWIYASRSRAAAFILWLFVAATWVSSALYAAKKSTTIDARRSRLERVLDDLSS